MSGSTIRRCARVVSILGMLEGVLKEFRDGEEYFSWWVSILGMLEGVLKGWFTFVFGRRRKKVSILGMLEGVLKVSSRIRRRRTGERFNPWYVGGGVKRPIYMYLPHA